MSFDGFVYNVMIASPGDVANERTIAREVIAEWNAVHAPDRRLVLLPISGDVNATPAMGVPPQEVINRQVLRAADLLVGIFWTRIGTATSSYASGTVEEIEEQIKAGKPVMLYFSETPVHPDVGATEQYLQLRSFKESLRSRGLFETFSSPAEFREKFNRQLQIKVNRDSYFVSKPLPSDMIAEELMVRLQSSIATFLELPRPNTTTADTETSYEVQALLALAHQTQGQLIGVSGALTAVGSEGLSARDKDLVEIAKFLIEDAITVGYGTFSSYALSSGREIALLENLIKPPEELERITRRLQRTSARSDLQLRFSTQLGFSSIHFDKNVFESVFYNVIHNAMKYAERSSVV
ncbi:MAG TPA: hypothetical protein VNN25_06960, partial [Thermoanaerobaculia bacterium]|nr:hypothetical protein [Thermoanaerobaculia bacterium]